MKIESFIAGAILGAFFSNKDNQKLLKNATEKTASMVVDALNKRGGIIAPDIESAISKTE